MQKKVWVALPLAAILLGAAFLGGVATSTTNEGGAVVQESAPVPSPPEPLPAVMPKIPPKLMRLVFDDELYYRTSYKPLKIKTQVLSTTVGGASGGGPVQTAPKGVAEVVSFTGEAEYSEATVGTAMNEAVKAAGLSGGGPSSKPIDQTSVMNMAHEERRMYLKPGKSVVSATAYVRTHVMLPSSPPKTPPKTKEPFPYLMTYCTLTLMEFDANNTLLNERIIGGTSYKIDGFFPSEPRRITGAYDYSGGEPPYMVTFKVRCNGITSNADFQLYSSGGTIEAETATPTIEPITPLAR